MKNVVRIHISHLYLEVQNCNINRIFLRCSLTTEKHTNPTEFEDMSTNDIQFC